MSEGDCHSDGISRENALENYYKLPAVVKRRVRALKKLQYETIKIDAAFYRELLELEMKYDKDHQQIFETRKSIVTGIKEPADDECDWPSDDEHPGPDGDEVEKLCDEVGNKAKLNKDNDSSTVDTADIKGIPDFWLQTMRNVSLLSESIEDHDVEILKHLADIKCILHSDDPGFTLEFHFNTNPYFTNKVLTKRYYFNYDISPDDPFDFEGPEIVRTKGCTINWNPGKNVTVKVIKKVQKKKGASGGAGAKRTITKSVQEDSFFNFFDPPTQTLSEELDEDIQMLLETDFKMGQFLRDSVIPKAVLFFTGEAVISDSDDEDDEDDDDDDDDDDEDVATEDEDEENAAPHHGGARHRRPKATNHNAAAGEQPECKQQ